MDENEIERLDTLSLPFDAEVMNSIGTIESADLPPGHVGQQLSPGYRWRGNLLRFADVRISK
ncbi:MAG: nucleotide exchange factor GrpE [Fuerstiella sp.]|nr:nucleotide exchange factor GrpE [Fuerstiella sp.]